jgi:lipoprotein-anchoring transpeptidase ErfK/SrfK
MRFNYGRPVAVVRDDGYNMNIHKVTLVLVSTVPILFVAAIAYQLANANAPVQQHPPTVSPTSVASAAEVETPTPAATSTALPDRTSCAEIRGTEYRSGSEREFYLAKCLPTPTPTPVVMATRAPPAVPGSERPGERWVLVDIATQRASAMIGNELLYTALVTTGKQGWETPKGTFRIGYRVANETMTSASIGAEEEYVLENVLYTQYFTNDGHALHLNYWRSDDYFGRIPSSHGCVGMRLADAEFFWRFATQGTRIVIQ